MKLFAQHGAQEGEKIAEGLKRELLDGIIYSPRDIALSSLKAKLAELAEEKPSFERLFDPQYYVTFLSGKPEARLGFLEEYQGYFKQRRRAQLERERQVTEDVRATLRFQIGLRLTGLIAPNILVPRSFNSIEAVIAKNFIRAAGVEHLSLSEQRPVYATLAVSREALSDKQELIEFLNEITVLDEPPRGFYVLIAARSTEARSDIYNADVIAAWMLINHTLRVNGFDVINGCSDILTPLLGASGASAGAVGWWSNLRTFSLDRFAPAAGGGRLPIPRYLSVNLLNRITFTELDALRALVPGILNGLPLDAMYSTVTGSEPPRNLEVLQSWEAIKALNSKMSAQDQSKALQCCRQAVQAAAGLYETIPIPLDSKSNNDHLEALLEGLSLFAKLAEL
jgi:hypothetical protein